MSSKPVSGLIWVMCPPQQAVRSGKSTTSAPERGEQPVELARVLVLPPALVVVGPRRRGSPGTARRAARGAAA